MPGRTAGLLYLAEKGGPGALSLPAVAAIAARHGLPVLCDAASVLPPKARLWKYLDEGADLVCFKGGGGIRGPQSTGLVLGGARWVAEARANAFPNQAVLRAAKVCRRGAGEAFIASPHESPSALVHNYAESRFFLTG